MTHRQIGVGVAALILTLSTAGVASPAQPKDETFGARSDTAVELAATQLSKDFGVSLAEARRRIQRQEAESILSSQLASRFVGYGGMYIDQADGGAMVISYQDERDLPDIVQATVAYRLADIARYRQVQHSLRWLTSESQAVENAYLKSGVRGGFQTSVDVATNRVEARYPLHRLSARAQSLLSYVRRDHPEVAVKADDNVWAQQAFCNTSVCDPPMRGGIHIFTNTSAGNGDDCTGGFVVHDAFQTYLLTAGHCIWHARTVTWRQQQNDALVTGHVIGDVTKVEYGNFTTNHGDAAIVTVNSPGSTGWNVQPWVYIAASSGGGHPTTLNDHYAITGVGAYSTVPVSGSPAGQYLCKTGYISDTTCGVIVASNLTVNYTDTTVTGLAQVAAQVCHGDSGGPVYVSSKGYGLVSGLVSTDPNASCASQMYYQGLQQALTALNVTLNT